MTSNQGSLALVEADGDTSAILETDHGLLVHNGDSLITQGANNGTLLITHPDSEVLLLRGQLYANSTLILQRASTPRYGMSELPDQVRLKLDNGRLRLDLPPENEQPVIYELEVPQGILELSAPGQYALVTTAAETQVSAFEGSVTLTAASGKKLAISDGERAILFDGGDPTGPYATSRNLVKNGSFDNGFDDWIVQDWIIELADQPAGETKLDVVRGEHAVRFIRPGAGHAETSVRQIIDQDVTDFELLELVITLRIHGQSLWVCGTVGSECPLLVRLEYEDALGVARIWEQGFFADGEVSTDYPDSCQTCSLPSNRHLRVQPKRILSQEINLIEALQGFPPSQIRSLSISTAGHAFDSEVFDISLNARE